jgi:hypothetical protein
MRDRGGLFQWEQAKALSFASTSRRFTSILVFTLSLLYHRAQERRGIGVFLPRFGHAGTTTQK